MDNSEANKSDELKIEEIRSPDGKLLRTYSTKNLKLEVINISMYRCPYFEIRYNIMKMMFCRVLLNFIKTEAL